MQHEDIHLQVVGLRRIAQQPARRARHAAEEKDRGATGFKGLRDRIGEQVGFADPGFAHNGALAGLVAVCAGSDLFHPIGALVVGGVEQQRLRMPVMILQLHDHHAVRHHHVRRG